MYRQNRRQCIIALLLVLCLLPGGHTAFATGGGHTETTPYNWFFCKTEDHSPPPLGSGLEFTQAYPFYYLDRRASEDDKVIYLTFDVGYENGNVEKILDALQDHQATGAFFVLSHVVLHEQALVKRMLDEGHTVGNHTARHPDMSAIRDAHLFADQLQTLEKQFLECYGQPLSRYYRPPEGRFTEQNLRFAEKLGYKTILWSYAYADWDNRHQPDEQAAIDRILQHTHNGMVLLLHPTSGTNAAILDRLLTAWEQEGYRFGSLDELCAR